MAAEGEKNTPEEIQAPYQPARKHIYPELGPTTIEHSASEFEEISNELGFAENEKLRLLGVRFVNLLRETPEPTLPADMDEDYDCPDEVINLIREYQTTAEEILQGPPGQERRADIREQMGLEIAYAGMFQAGGWKTMARRRIYDAHQYAREMDTQFPEIFCQIS